MHHPLFNTGLKMNINKVHSFSRQRYLFFRTDNFFWKLLLALLFFLVVSSIVFGQKGRLILAAVPTHGTPVLNSTSEKNTTIENLTVYNVSTADADGDPVKNIYGWYRNNTPLALANLPFEGGSNATNTTDYSGYNSVVVINGTSITWNSSAGIDGRGAYDFDGTSTSDMMRITNPPTTLTNGFSIVAWIKPRELDSNYHLIFGRCVVNSWFAINNANRLAVSYGNSTGQQKTFTSAVLPSANQWYHAALTVHPNSTVNIYINGSINASETLNQGISTAFQNQQNIGNFETQCDLAYWAKFNGTIDEFAFYNLSLTPAQVLALYNNRTNVIDSSMLNSGDTWNASITPNDGTGDGTTRFSTNLTIRGVPTVETPVFNVSTVTKTTGIRANTTYRHIESILGNISFTWYKNNSVVFTENFTSISHATIVNTTLNTTFYNKSDLLNITAIAFDGNVNSTLNFSTTLTVADAIPTQGTPILNSTRGKNRTDENFTVYNVSTVDPDGDPIKNIYSWFRNNTPIAILNLPFEGGSNATNTTDYSGRNRAIIINGTSITWNSSAGIDGKGAYDFDGSNTSDMMRFTSAPTMGNGFSVVAWIKPIELDSTYHMIFGNCDYINFYYVISNTNRLLVSYANSTGQQKSLETAVLPSANIWYHVAFTIHPNSTVNLYINGTINASASLNQGIQSTTLSTYHIGNSQTQCGLANFPKFNGTIDEFAFYNMSLTPDQVLALYNNRTNVIDSSMLQLDDTWNASITPNDGQADGATLYTPRLTIVGHCP